MKAKLKELKEELAKAKTERDNAISKLANMKFANELALDKARLEKEIEMRKLIDDAYDKGYNRCKENLKDARSLMSSI
jgi:hypothetical protein